MKKLLLRAGLACCVCSAVGPVFAYISTPSDPDALPATKNVYSYIASRAGQTANKMIEGQHLGGINQLLYPSIYGTFDINNHEIDGKLPGFVGTRYDADDKQTHQYVLDPTICTAMNDELIVIWNEHQPIIHITAIPPNPWNPQSGREPYDAPNNKLNALLLNAPASTAKTNFWNSIDVIADALQELEDAGIPVVFRPFAEFNMANKYYYAQQSSADFVALWKDVYDYYIGVRGLHNLLFCWEVWALNRNTAMADIGPWYPGDNYADIVAGAYYFKPGISYLDANGDFTFANSDPEDQGIFDFLVGQDRPFGAAQYGLNYLAGGQGDHDFTRKFMTYAPQMAFAYYWTNEYAVQNQASDVAFVNDSRVATADDLPGFSTLTFASTAAEDGWVLESSEASGIGGSFDASATGTSALKTGDDASRRQFKGIVSFDTNPIPDGAIITSATLQLTRGAQYGNPAATLGTLNVDIKTGSFSTGAALESNDFQATATHTGVTTLAVPAADGGVTTGTLNSNGLGAIKKTGKTQFRITFAIDDDNDGVGDNIGWYSGDNATPANRPQLTVEYKYQ